MLEFLEDVLRRFHTTVGWSDSDQYSAMCAASARILDFQIPEGLTVSMGKSVSPVLRSSFAVGVPARRSAAFMTTSVPVDMPAIRPVLSDAILGAHRRRRAAHAVRAAMTASEKSSGQRTLIGPWVLYGRVFEDLRLEALAGARIGSDAFATVTTLSDWQDGGDSNMCAQLAMSRNEFCAETSFNSDNMIIGGSILGHLTTDWSAGAEVFYTAAERSGGLSLGARMSKEYAGGGLSELTFVANPIMGHMIAAYAATVRRGMHMATRFDLNVHSLEADLAVGVEYAPKDRDQVLKARVSLMQGIAICLDGKLQQARYSIGIGTTFDRAPRQTIGVEVQF